MKLYLAWTVTYCILSTAATWWEFIVGNISPVWESSQRSRCAWFVEPFPPWLNWYALDYSVFFGSLPFLRLCVCAFILNSLPFLFSCASGPSVLAESSMAWNRPRSGSRKLDSSCGLVIFNVNSGRLECMMMGTSDRMGKLTKHSGLDSKKDMGNCFGSVTTEHLEITADKLLVYCEKLFEVLYTISWVLFQAWKRMEKWQLPVANVPILIIPLRNDQH